MNYNDIPWENNIRCMNNYEKTKLEDMILNEGQSPEQAYEEMFKYVFNYVD